METRDLRGRPLLEAALERITNPAPGAPGWDQAKVRYETPCGTTMCLAGHVLDLLGVEWGGRGSAYNSLTLPEDVADRDFVCAARNALGWSLPTAFEAFIGAMDEDDPGVFAARVRWLDDHRDGSYYWGDAVEAVPA